MGDVVHHVDTRNVLLLEEIDGLTFLFTENRHQNIGTGNLLAPGRLYMEDRALQYALKSERRLGFPLGVASRNERRSRIDILIQICTQLFDICANLIQHIDSDVVVEQCQQQVLYSHKFMTFALGDAKSFVQRGL